ncbi:hypothetical protein LDENG_00002000 [Lucifuga dentata]|nr:hypothetical protein LDENG_00002000 [Lucifuga dentata]
MDELEIYQQMDNRKSVLLFPPLPSRLRYLIHKTTEDLPGLPGLATFSVGESWCRRVVVCYSELRGEVEEDSDLESNSNLCEESLRGSGELVSDSKPKSSDSSRKRGPKRPDKPLYMPRAARERLSLQNPRGPSGGLNLSSLASSSCSCSSSSADSCSCSDTAENTNSSTSNQESLHNVPNSIFDHVPNSSPLCPQDEKQDLVPRQHEAESLASDQTALTSEEDENEKEDLAGVPHSPQREDTNTDTDDFMEEIKAHLKDSIAFSVEHVHNDYSGYENVWLNPDDFRHVIEIYDFPSVFKVDDLLDAFTEYSEGGMKIKWVDDTHALGIFSTESAALHALSICHPLLKARALAEGSKKAKGKAIRRAEFIQPVKARPRTDCAVARRMVTRALGLQGERRVQRY